VTSVVAQILVPLAAHLAPESERGHFVGRVMSGLLIGILLARTVSSLLAAAWGWRSVYIVSAVLMLSTAAVLAIMLPNRRPDHTTGYPELLKSVVQIAREEPLVRRRAIGQALMFAAFSSFRTSITYQLIKTHHFSQTGIAIFALVGAAGAIADARARINTVYMGTVFLGGAVGSAVSRLLYERFGWTGSAVFGASLPLIGFALWLASDLSARNAISS
jgi:predicted MFS family arabinose efflux permease